MKNSKLFKYLNNKIFLFFKYFLEKITKRMENNINSID